MVELRNGKQADQMGIHQPAQAHHYANVDAHANAKRKDSLAYEHGLDNQPVSHVDAGDDLPRILEEIGEEERRQEQEQQQKQQQQQFENWSTGNHGFDSGDFEHHQQHGQLSLPQDYHDNVQSIPQKRAHSDIALLNFDDDDIQALDGEKMKKLDEIDEQEEQKLEDMLKDQGSKGGEKQVQVDGEKTESTMATYTGPSLDADGMEHQVPIQPPDRRPTPGRINNPRAVNEEGAAPMYSRGVVDEFPWKTDPNYSRRSYMSIDEHGMFHDDEDAPEGPPKKKGRHNNPDRLKWEEEQPMADPNRSSHAYHLCASRGPNGPPTYDSAGYLLDYEKCVDYTRPKLYNKNTMMNRMNRSLERSKQEQEKMAHLFFEPDAVPKDKQSPQQVDHWRDRVSKDLGVPWHTVGVEKFEEWDRKGFPKARKNEYERFEKEEEDRMMELLSGGTYRAGSKA
ncbi:hypothetical protein BKA81DRAFT_369240 [Phyllosticta paracitricarpa]|uniref:Uncharacterized protein n=2 Tax=Phyllosticta TaxID=121621 RepID=A0ABR1LBN8_9PEZI